MFVYPPKDMSSVIRIFALAQSAIYLRMKIMYVCSKLTKSESFYGTNTALKLKALVLNISRIPHIKSDNGLTRPDTSELQSQCYCL
jgi:hypothetical protein